MSCSNISKPDLGKRHDYAISVIRFVSLLLIISCHMMQHESFFLAWWFNVGVQIFLCISGYLYGQKTIGDIPKFYGDRFKKILIPYYIAFLVFGIAEFVFARQYFNPVRFCGGLLCRTTLTGGGHLWFISTILFCYILTPLLFFYKTKYVKSPKSFWLGTFLSVSAVSIYCGLYNYFNPAWISCFVLGYALGVNDEKRYVCSSLLIWLSAVFAFCGNAAQIYIDSKFSFSGLQKIAFSYFKDYNHVWLGIFLFVFMKTLLGKVDFANHPGLTKNLNIADKYSYEAFLVHQFLILGPFSLMSVTPFLPLNIAIILVVIAALAWILKTVEKSITSTHCSNDKYGLYICDGKVSDLKKPEGYELHENLRISSDLFGLRMCIYWNIISLGKARAYMMTDANGAVAHSSLVMPKCYKFPFMRTPESGDIIIGPCVTREKDRGRGLYPYVLSQIVKSHNNQGAIYVIIHDDNTSSIKGAGKAGFEKKQRLKKTITKKFIVV